MQSKLLLEEQFFFLSNGFARFDSANGKSRLLHASCIKLFAAPRLGSGVRLLSDLLLLFFLFYDLLILLRVPQLDALQDPHFSVFLGAHF